MCVAQTFSEPSDGAGLRRPLVTGPGGANDWHALDAAVVLTQLRTNTSSGLTTEEVRQRRLRYGANALQEIRPRPAWRLLIDQFASIVIALLAVAAAVAWVTGDVLQAIAILVVLIINAFVGFVTEWQARRALDALRRQGRTIARVRRDGLETTIDAEDLLPGDIIVLNAGDRYYVHVSPLALHKT